MKQNINNNEADLAAVGEAVAIGLDDLAVEMDLDPTLAATIRGLIAAMLTARTSAQLGNNTVRARKAAVRTAMSGCKLFLTLAREILKPHLGGQYSQDWDITGFVGSLTIPRTAAKMQLILAVLKAYLLANPTRENAPLNVTAAQATLLLTQLQAAVGALNLQQTDTAGFRTTRIENRNELRLTLRMLVATLTVKMPPLDDRWLSFGLNKPGAEETPPAPEGLEVVVLGPNTLSAKWPATPRAEYYRLWLRVNGEAELASLGTCADLNFLFEQLPANAQVEVAISAGNTGGESAKSEIVLVQMP